VNGSHDLNVSTELIVRMILRFVHVSMAQQLLHSRCSKYKKNAKSTDE
jgi:hypothetical protein